MDLEGSRTEKNLYKTYAGECRARTKYNLYSEKARADGYVWISEIFNMIAGNEYAHAREAYKRYLKKVCDTENNLIDSALGEAEESQFIYCLKNLKKLQEKKVLKKLQIFIKNCRK